MTPDDFWRSTPALFFAMMEQKGKAIKRHDRAFAVLTTVVRQIAGDKKAGLWDYWPEHENKEEKKARQVVSSSEAYQNFKALVEFKKKIKAGENG